MANLLSLPKQVPCQDLVQPGAILSQHIETPFYRNQIDYFQRTGHDDYHSRQNLFSNLYQRNTYPVDYSVNSYVNERVSRPSTPTVSPLRLPKSHMSTMNCPLISITSDNATSYVMYQDESDESDDKIIEEEESNIEQDEVTTKRFNYSATPLNSLEEIATPPEKYAEAKDRKQSLLTPPLIFDSTFFDAIPYIDQTEDTNFARTSECVQEESNNKRDCCNESSYNDNSNVKGCQEYTNVDCNHQQQINVTDSTLKPNMLENSSFINTSSLLGNKSILSTNNVAIQSNCIAVSNNKSHKSQYFQSVDNSINCKISIDTPCDRLDDASNSEDYADESSSSINDDCTLNKIDANTEEEISTLEMYTVMPELHLDLSGLNSNVTTDVSKTEKCWKSPEEVRLGCGRVAALAKHFSKLGDAGLIKFKSTKLTDSRQFVSEPDIIITENSNGCSCKTYYAKEYKSDSDLMKEVNVDSKNNLLGKDNAILIDTKTEQHNPDIEKCSLHRYSAKQVTRSPLVDDNKQQFSIHTKKNLSLSETEDNNVEANKSINQILLDTKENTTLIEVENHNASVNSNISQLTSDVKKNINLAIVEDHNMTDDNIKTQFSVNTREILIENGYHNELNKNVTIKNDAKLSLEEQKVVLEQLEQFSNLDNTDAPLFIPKRGTEQVSLTFPKNENAISAFNDSTESMLKDQVEKPISEDKSLVNINNNSQRIKKSGTSDSSSSSPTSVPSSPLHSSISPLSNAAKSSLSSEDIKLQTYQGCTKHPKSCLFIDISHSPAKNRFDDDSSTGSSILPSPSYKCLRSMDNKLNILRVRVARPCCSSEDNLINAAIYKKESKETVTNHCDKFSKLAHSCENIPDKESLSDFTNRTQSSESLYRDIVPSSKSCDRLNLKAKEKAKWYCHHSLEELKSKKGTCKQNALTNLNLARPIEIPKKSDCKKLRKKRMNYDLLRESALELSRQSQTKTDERQKWIFERKSQSELDISRQKSDSGRDGWSFREIGSLKDDDRSTMRKLLPCVMHRMYV